MKSVAKPGITGLGILFTVVVALASATAQTPPKPGAKAPPPPPKGQSNQGTQNSAQQQSQNNSGNRSGAQQQNQANSSNRSGNLPNSQTKRYKMISSAEMEHMQLLGSQLGLNENQFSRIASIVNTAHMSDSAVEADTSLTPAQKHQKLLAIQKNKREQIDEVLTPRERTRLQEIERGS